MSGDDRSFNEAMQWLVTVGVIAFLAALAGGAGAWGRYSGLSFERAQAIRAGVAEWRLDRTTGESTFVYLKAGK